QKNRVFAAGPTSNIVLALVADSILSLAFLSSVSVANDGHGVVVASVTDGSAAAQAGLRAGDVLTRVAGQAVSDRDQYTGVMNRTFAGEQVTLEWLRDGTPMRAEAVLTDRYD